MSYLNLVKEFFEEIFDEKYLIVSIPFVILVSGVSTSITSYFYQIRIKDLKNQNEVLLVMNNQYNTALQNMQQSRVQIEQPQASAPPLAYLYSYV